VGTNSNGRQSKSAVPVSFVDGFHLGYYSRDDRITTVGDALRISGGPPFGRLRVAVECKEVGQAGSVDEMRTFVARLYDLTVLNAHEKYIPYAPPTEGIYPGTPANNSFYNARVTYWDENRHSFNAVARRTGFRSGATVMTA
jgi:hypothetical protein